VEIPNDWYDGFFESEWLDDIALHTLQERTTEQVDFIVEQLGLEPGARILDVACGHGRHSLELERRGFCVTGTDLSHRSIELARKAAEDEGLDAEFVELDMRKLEYEAEFDAAINLFTAFGYFEDEAENEDVLARIARALRRDGRFLIDTINLIGLARRYQERLWDDLESGDGIIVQKHEFDFQSGRNSSVWTFIRDSGERSELAHNLRVYAPHELVRMFERAGLTVTGSWGDFEGSELDWESRRVILRGDKT
jgi:2-polyprenyl-3-methyl-5-hydroxy-6-metoxy-1,4-benzoquinol methylase